MNWVGWVLAYWNVVQSVVELVLVAAVVYFAWVAQRLTRGLERSSREAMEHGHMMMKLEAQRQGIPMMWWDPTVESFPYEEPGHGKECRIGKIATALPEHLRMHRGKAARRQERELRREAREKHLGA